MSKGFEMANAVGTDRQRVEPCSATEQPDVPSAPGHAMGHRDAEVVMRPWSGGPPLVIVEARGCQVTDEQGRDYLDFTSGYFVNQVGHCHPRVVEAATRQLGQVMQVSGKQATPASIALAERLAAETPDSIDKVFFATGGSEATEFALKMARQHGQNETVAYLENGYHGLTLGALEVCANDRYRQSAGVVLSERALRLPTPYCYRCRYRDDCATQCVDEAERQLDERGDVAALIAEPVQAVGGIIPPERWWRRIEEMRERRRLLLVLDEIQTGLGRTGTMFAAEHYGLQPDVMTAGKGLGGGVGALSAAMASSEVAETFYGGTSPTNAGNAVSAAAGLALIDTIVAEDLLPHVRRMGRYLQEAAEALADPWIGDVRFKGLLGGIELVSDRASQGILPRSLVQEVHDRLRERGMLITISGMYGNVLRVQPPLSIASAQIDAFIAALQASLVETRAGRPVASPSESHPSSPAPSR